MKTSSTTRWGTWTGAVLFALLAVARPAIAADPLVNVEWVKANLDKPGIVYVDFQPPADFLRGHIPGAVNSNYGKDGWREERASDKVPDMLPAKLDVLGEMIGKLGIDNNTHVVLVPSGTSSTDMGVGTRVYWTFKVLGHDKVSLLDGGMAAWTKDKKNPLQAGAPKVEPKTFKVAVRKEMIVTMDDVKAAIDDPAISIVDALWADSYASGHIPTAVSLPTLSVNWVAYVATRSTDSGMT